jgi:hypothetical protein
MMSRYAAAFRSRASYDTRARIALGELSVFSQDAAALPGNDQTARLRRQAPRSPHAAKWRSPRCTRQHVGRSKLRKHDGRTDECGFHEVTEPAGSGQMQRWHPDFAAGRASVTITSAGDV